MPTISLKKESRESTDSETNYVTEGKSEKKDQLALNESDLISMSFDSEPDTDSPATKGKLFLFEDSNTS